MKDALNGIIDIIFPPRCPFCQTLLHDKGTFSCCDACASRIKTIFPPQCTVCGIPFPTSEGSDHLCGDCILSPKAFSIARAVGYYEGTLLDAIHGFKYRRKSALGQVLGKIMADHDYPDFPMSSYTRIMPVPLHVRRLRERTFNQSLILAAALARKYAIPLDFTALKRHIYTEPQIALGKSDRQVNVRGAFQVKYPEKIRGEKVLLIDDVYTTGSTLNECARVLVQNGARDVGVLTLARAL